MLDLSSRKVYGALKDEIDYVDRKLDDAMVQIWSPGGSYTFENLPAPSADTFRFAYVVTDDFTTTNDFVEGAGIDYPAGTVVGVVNRGTDANPVYMYDVSTGAVFVDSEPTQGSTNAVSSGGVYNDLQEIELSISQLSASLLLKADKDADAIEDNLASFDDGGNPVDSGISKDMLSTDTITTPASNPVTFETASAQIAEGFELLATAEQDLHGYDKPWAGGAYKNKLPLVLADIKAVNTVGTWSGNVYSIANGTFEVLTDNDGNVTGIKVNGDFNANALFILAQNVTLSDYSNKILSGCPSGGASGVFGLSIAQTASPYKSTTTYGNDETIRSDWEDVTNGYIYILVYASNTVSNKTFYPMIRLASVSDSTFAPYSNICPIVGFSEKNVNEHGKNYFDKTQFDSGKSISTEPPYNEYPSANYSLSKYIEVKSNKTYHITNNDGSVPAYNTAIVFFDENKNGIGSAITQGAFTTVANTKYIKFDFKINLENVIQLEEDSASEYEPYTGTDYTISFGSTVYGVKVTEQGCEVTHEIITLNGTEVWYESTNDRVYTGFEPGNNCKASTIPISDWLNGTIDIVTDDVNGIYINSSKSIVCRLSGVTSSATTWKDYLANHNLHVCYELATPIPLPISPIVLALLAGTNVITTDGDSIKVTYRDGVVATLDDVATLETEVDTKADEAYLAKVESGATASRAYSVNEFMVRSDGFYKVTANIASGASITSSNTTKVTVGEVLTALLNA